MQIYTVSYNMPKGKGISIDFLSLVDKLCRSLPHEAYVQGVSLQSGVLTIRSPKPIKNLRDLVVKHTTDRYTLNTITTLLPPY
jgi:hypothetical protein